MTTGRSRLLRDIALILVMITVGTVLLLVSGSRREEGAYIVVMVQNEEVARYSLAIDGIYDIDGGTNTIEIENGRVRMVEAFCPNHLCIRQGWIHLEGQSIVCLPNKVTVIVRAPGSGYDFVQ